jgi:hypothetical protein
VSFPKVCGCQRSYDAVAWASLPLVGRQQVPADPTDFEQPEAYVDVYRNCPCGSTLAVSEADDQAAEDARREREAEHMRKLRADLLGGRVRQVAEELHQRTAHLAPRRAS